MKLKTAFNMTSAPTSPDVFAGSIDLPTSLRFSANPRNVGGNYFYNNPLTALYSLFICFCLLICTQMAHAGRWQPISPGVYYQDLEGGLLNPWAHIYVFKIDLKQNRFQSVTAKSLGLLNASTDQFVERSHSLIGVNGGFFDKSFKPLGLRLNDNHTESPLKRISWWGVFYIQDQQAHISSMQQFNHGSPLSFAVQSGPRLLINGKIPSLKPGAAERTALGIRKDGTVIILVTNALPLSTRQLAKLMKSPPLSCIQAINLDGGSSSQIYAHVGSFKLNVRGFSNVSDAVVVKKI